MDPSTPIPQTRSFLKQRLFSRRFLFLGVTALFLLFIPILIAGFTIYSDARLPLVKGKFRQRVARFFYRIPFFPKTPEMILLTAIEENTQITTYRPDFSFSADLGSTGIGAASLDLRVGGPVDYTAGKKFSFDLEAEGVVNFTGSIYKASGHVRKVEDTVYGKINDVSDNLIQYTGFNSGQNAAKLAEIKQNLQKVFANWLVYDTKGLESQARKELEKRASSQSLIDTTRRKTQEFLLRSEVLPEVKRLDDEEIKGVSSYHLQLTPSRELMQSLIPEEDSDTGGDTSRYGSSSTSRKLLLNNIIDGVDSLQIDAWFGKKDAILRKLSIQSQINLVTLLRSYSGYGLLPGGIGSFLENLATPKLSLSIVITIGDIGKVVKVDVPAPTLPLDEYRRELNEALKTKEERQREERRKVLNEDLHELNLVLTKHYVENGVYPGTLNELVGAYIPPSSGLAARLAEYQYRVAEGRNNFIVYIEDPEIRPYAETPYYGFTSEFSYSRDLRKKDFDLVQTSITTAPIPALPYTPTPTLR